MDFIEKAKTIRAQLDNLTSAMTDEQALESSALFPEWRGDGVSFTTNQRVLYNNVLYKVLQPHTSQPDWSPETAVSLFAKVLVSVDGTVLEWVQPDSTNPYMKGDKVTFEGSTYESLIDNNVWSPSSYPAGWKVCSE